MVALRLLIVLLFCSSVLAQTFDLSGVIRDQAPNTMLVGDCAGNGSVGFANKSNGFYNTDFQQNNPVFNERGLVGPECNAKNGWFPPACGYLGHDQKPVYAYNGSSPMGSVRSNFSFFTWFHDTNYTVNLPYTYTMSKINGYWVFNNSVSFFPVDGKGWGDSCLGHNYAFCLELHASFTYGGGETVTLGGDDDTFLFLDNRLVVDLGGVHPIHTSENVNIDAMGLSVGSTYPFDLFFCERHTTESDLLMSTNLNFVVPSTETD